MTVRVCRACDEEITTPNDAVFLWHEEAMSGPGWDVWAHREHADLVDMVDSTLLRIMTRIWAAQMQG
ncbi:hypothetical protein [Streptomyces sp. NPDC048419]|uniref:hypothetical protein n=1 Tax=Streptomyces sp. NPDC048419 TaxID=3365547 RepID=UPI0037116F63